MRLGSKHAQTKATRYLVRPSLNMLSEAVAIIHKHDINDGLFVVSEGSIKLHNMSFGWVIANLRGEILVQGSGPSAGKGSSL